MLEQCRDLGRMIRFDILPAFRRNIDNKNIAVKKPLRIITPVLRYKFHPERLYANLLQPRKLFRICYRALDGISLRDEKTAERQAKPAAAEN